MKLNSKTRIVGEQVILVPYEKKHVLKYHEWMKLEELQELTGSEPLSLPEEYAMQESWRDDEDKCTFIILDKLKYQSSNEIDAMIGDTNLFLQPNQDCKKAEGTIMIAESEARGKRKGWEAFALMLLYSINYLGIELFEVKIVSSNTASIKLFEKLSFVEVDRNEIFREITLERKVDEEWINWLKKQSIHDIKDDYE